jgi:hypothetical protein
VLVQRQRKQTAAGQGAVSPSRPPHTALVGAAIVPRASEPHQSSGLPAHPCRGCPGRWDCQCGPAGLVTGVGHWHWHCDGGGPGDQTLNKDSCVWSAAPLLHPKGSMVVTLSCYCRMRPGAEAEAASEADLRLTLAPVASYRYTVYYASPSHWHTDGPSHAVGPIAFPHQPPCSAARIRVRVETTLWP